MDIIPLVHLKEGRLLEHVNGDEITIADLRQLVQKDQMIYLLDYDGIQYDDPDVELYQKLAETFQLWIDEGPRILDDAMDVIMAGAVNLTIRPSLWDEKNYSGIREILEGDLFLAVDSERKETTDTARELTDISGTVYFEKEDIVTCMISTPKAKTYLVNIEPSSLPFWKDRGVTGVLVDIGSLARYQA